MNDFIPTTVRYEQPLTCTRCGMATFQGIKEYDEYGRKKERGLCKPCSLVFLQEYMQYLTDRIAHKQDG